MTEDSFQPVTLSVTVFDAAHEPALDVAFELFGERRRVIVEEKFDAAHDDAYAGGELERAASAYAYGAGCPAPWFAWLIIEPKVDRPNGGSHILETLRMLWPFDFRWWKPGPADGSMRRRMLVKAGGFIIAAIEKIDLAAAAKAQQGETAA